MYHTISSEVKKITPKAAQAMEALNILPAQRRRDPIHVDYLADEMRKDRFRVGEIGIAVLRYNKNAEVLVNGQHQLQACVLSQTPFRATVSRYECEKETDLWHLYGSFDVHKARSISDIGKAARELFANPHLRPIPMAMLTKLAKALLILRGGTAPDFAMAATSKVSRFDLIEEFADDCLWVESFWKKNNETVMPLAAVIAMIATRRISADEAEAFWLPVISGVQIPNDSPQLAVNLFLSGRSAACGHLPNGGTRTEAMFNYIASWWNSWITGEARRSVKLSAIKETVKLSEPMPAVRKKAG